MIPRYMMKLVVQRNKNNVFKAFIVAKVKLIDKASVLVTVY